MYNFRKGTRMNEIVLYYAPENIPHMSLVKGVLVQMGVKIKNLTPERCVMKIGSLVGMEGFEKEKVSGQEKQLSLMREEMMILAGFTDERLEALLANLKKAGVPRINLKAIVTETNAGWTPCELYLQLAEEHRQMNSW